MGQHYRGLNFSINIKSLQDILKTVFVYAIWNIIKKTLIISR